VEPVCSKAFARLSIGVSSDKGQVSRRGRPTLRSQSGSSVAESDLLNIEKNISDAEISGASST